MIEAFQWASGKVVSSITEESLLQPKCMFPGNKSWPGRSPMTPLLYSL